MFEKISIDCLGIIFSFVTTKEMGNVSCVSKECRRLVRKCDYAWYLMYTRFVMTLSPVKHEGPYTYECLRNPCIPDGCRKGRTSQSLIARVHQICTPVNFASHQEMIRHRYYILDANKLKSLDYQRGNKSVDLNIVNKINEKLKHCVNPKHQCIPVYDSGVNYRRKHRIEYLTHHKKTKFTDSDEKKLNKYKQDYDNLVQKQQRYINGLLYITMLKAKDCILTVKDVKKMNDLCDKIKALERKQRIAKLMENYE